MCPVLKVRETAAALFKGRKALRLSSLSFAQGTRETYLPLLLLGVSLGRKVGSVIAVGMALLSFCSKFCLVWRGCSLPQCFAVTVKELVSVATGASVHVEQIFELQTSSLP